MASFVGKFVAKRILKEGAANKFGTDDPYFEYVPATRMDGSHDPKKMKKIKKALPPGLTENDQKILKKVKRRAYRLDMSLFNLCGVRFGWSSVIGFVPAIGDVLDMLLALMVMRTCYQIDGGLPASVKSKMILNIILDFVVGLVPFIGDIADAALRANTRNAALLEAHLRDKGRKQLRQSKLEIPPDYSDPTNWDAAQEQGGTPPRMVSEPPSRHETMEPVRQQQQQPLQSSGTTNGNGRGNNGNYSVESPAPAQVRESRSGGLGRLFSGRSNSRPADLEMGNGASGNSSAGRQQQQQQQRQQRR